MNSKTYWRQVASWRQMTKNQATAGNKHIRPDKVEDEPFVWEAGRATSAAPGFFSPAVITSLGSFQDGGLRHNNPMDLALWECPKLWSTSTSADVVLSLGTGKDKEVKSPKAPNFRHVFADGFLVRLCRLLWSSMDGERRWRDVTNCLDDDTRADYFRLNVPFEGDEPRLDNIQCIHELRRSVQLEPNTLRDRSGIAFALLVASFFFELAAIPIFEVNHYTCQGLLRCRNNSRAVLESLTRLYGTTRLEFVNDNEGLGMLTPEDICPLCHMYSKKVQFNVRHLEDVICINLRVHGQGQRKISGFPHNLAWFISQQSLDARLGTVTHDSTQNIRCGANGLLKTCVASGEVGRADRTPPDAPRVTHDHAFRVEKKRKFDSVSDGHAAHKPRKLGRSSVTRRR